MVSMQRSCAHAKTYARPVAGPRRTLTSAPTAPAQAADREHGSQTFEKPPKPIHMNLSQYKPVQVSTSEYDQ
jgi:hypothetical protein